MSSKRDSLLNRARITFRLVPRKGRTPNEGILLICSSAPTPAIYPKIRSEVNSKIDMDSRLRGAWVTECRTQVLVATCRLR